MWEFRLKDNMGVLVRFSTRKKIRLKTKYFKIGAYMAPILVGGWLTSAPLREPAANWFISTVGILDV